MVPHIVFHDPKTSRTVTVKTEREPIATDKEYTLTGPSSTLLNQNNLYEEITKVKTPFLLGVPRLLSPKDNEVINDRVETYFEISDAIFSDEFRGKITDVEWVIAQDEKFEQITYKKLIKFENIENKKLNTKDIDLSTLIGGGYVKARYISGKISSPYTKPIQFKILNKVVLKPEITEFGKGINIKYEISPFKINAENGRDLYSSNLYKIYKIPNEDLSKLNSYYTIDEKYLLTEFTKTTEDGSDTLSFPLLTPEGDSITLKAGNHIYIIQVRHRGKIYTSEIAYATINASGLRVATPELYIKDNELRPILGISEFKIPNGEDIFTNNQISVYEIEGKKETLIHNIKTKETEYLMPMDVCKSEKKYKIEVITHGTDYLPSLPGKITFTMPKIGIIKPLINLQNLGMEPKFTISPFKTVNCIDKWVGTEWELFIHGKIINDNLEPMTSLLKTYYTEKDISVLQLLKTELEPNTNYIMKVRFVGEKYKSEWSAINFKSTELEIGKPIVKAKVTGLDVELDISDFIVRGATDVGKEVWYYVAKLNPVLGENVYEQIGEPIKVKYYNKRTVINKLHGIVKDSKYKIVGKIIGEYFSTPFSDPVYIKTENIYIKPPAVNITGEPDRVPKRPTITTSAFSVSADTDKHIGTSYVIKELRGDNYIEIYKNEQDTIHLTELVIMEDILKVKTDYLLSVTHYGAEYGASETVTINFRTRNSFMEIPIDDEDGMQNIIIGSDNDEKTPKYFGTIPFNKLNNDRNYLGNWDGKRVYLKGEQVFYNNKLWYSTRNNNENRIPGIATPEGLHYWKEDNRWDLPTYKWLLKHIGFPTEVEDSNDGLSEGYNYVGSYKEGINSDVIKVALDGRILYIYNQIELENICYNDLVKMNLHSKRSRTIRISERLYYLRTLTSREVNELRKLKLLDNNNLISIDMHNQSFVSDEDQSDTEYRLVSNDQFKVEPHSATIRDMGLRLVLEYIPESQEPWKYYKNNEPNMIYDRYTDTGYFGSIDYCNINLYDQLGIINGTKINGDVGFLIFYYHGKKILISRKPIVFGIGYEDLFNIGVLYDPHAITPEGYTPGKITNLKISETQYINGNVRIPKGGSFALGNLGLVEDNYIKANDNLCRYSEWNELIYRVSNFDPKWVDTNYSHGGFQIGSNWDNYDNINLGVFEHYSGNGCYDYVMTSVNNNCIASRGGIKLEALHWIKKSEVRNDHGLRIVIEDLTQYIPNEYIPVDKPDPVIPWTPINPDTIIKTDPLDNYTLANIPVNNITKDYNVYKFNEPHNEDVNDKYIRYEIGESNILTPYPSLLNSLTIKLNNTEYKIDTIEELDPKGETILKDKGFYKDGVWYFPNRPSLLHYDNMNEPFNTIFLFFGTMNKIYKLKYSKNLDIDKDEYLRTLIDSEGNGDRINNYVYSILNITTPRSEIYYNNIMKTPVGMFNELIYLEITKDVISIPKPMEEITDNTIIEISKCDDDFKVFKINETFLDKLTDENMEYKTNNRPLYSFDSFKEFNLKTLLILKVLNNSVYTLYKIKNIRVLSLADLYYEDTCFKIDNFYYLPNDNAVYYKNNKLYLYHGYRLNYVNSDMDDKIICIEIDNDTNALLGLTNDILEAHNIQDFLIKNDIETIKTFDINVCGSRYLNLKENEISQFKGIMFGSIIKEDAVIPVIPEEPEIPEEPPVVDLGIRGVPFSEEEYNLDLKFEEHIQLDDGSYGDLYKIPDTNYCVFKSSYHGLSDTKCEVIGIMNYNYAKDQIYEFVRAKDLPNDMEFKQKVKTIIDSFYPEASVKSLCLDNNIYQIPDNPYISYNNMSGMATDSELSLVKNPRPIYLIINNELYLDISYEDTTRGPGFNTPMVVSTNSFDITDNLFYSNESYYGAFGYEKIARVNLIKEGCFILVHNGVSEETKLIYELHIEFSGKEIAKSRLRKINYYMPVDINNCEEVLSYINQNAEMFNLPKSDLICRFSNNFIQTNNDINFIITETATSRNMLPNETDNPDNTNIDTNLLGFMKLHSVGLYTTDGMLLKDGVDPKVIKDYDNYEILEGYRQYFNISSSANKDWFILPNGADGLVLGMKGFTFRALNPELTDFESEPEVTTNVSVYINPKRDIPFEENNKYNLMLNPDIESRLNIPLESLKINAENTIVIESIINNNGEEIKNRLGFIFDLTTPVIDVTPEPSKDNPYGYFRLNSLEVLDGGTLTPIENFNPYDKYLYQADIEFNNFIRLGFDRTPCIITKEADSSSFMLRFSIDKFEIVKSASDITFNIVNDKTVDFNLYINPGPDSDIDLETGDVTYWLPYVSEDVLQCVVLLPNDKFKPSNEVNTIVLQSIIKDGDKEIPYQVAFDFYLRDKVKEEPTEVIDNRYFNIRQLKQVENNLNTQISINQCLDNSSDLAANAIFGNYMEESPSYITIGDKTEIQFMVKLDYAYTSNLNPITSPRFVPELDIDFNLSACKKFYFSNPEGVYDVTKIDYNTFVITVPTSALEIGENSIIIYSNNALGEIRFKFLIEDETDYRDKNLILEFNLETNNPSYVPYSNYIVLPPKQTDLCLKAKVPNTFDYIWEPAFQNFNLSTLDFIFKNVKIKDLDTNEYHNKDIYIYVTEELTVDGSPINETRKYKATYNGSCYEFVVNLHPNDPVYTEKNYSDFMDGIGSVMNNVIISLKPLDNSSFYPDEDGVMRSTSTSMYYLLEDYQNKIFNIALFKLELEEENYVLTELSLNSKDRVLNVYDKITASDNILTFSIPKTLSLTKGNVEIYAGGIDKLDNFKMLNIDPVLTSITTTDEELVDGFNYNYNISKIIEDIKLQDLKGVKFSFKYHAETNMASDLINKEYSLEFINNTEPNPGNGEGGSDNSANGAIDKPATEIPSEITPPAEDNSSSSGIINTSKIFITYLNTEEDIIDNYLYTIPEFKEELDRWFITLGTSKELGYILGHDTIKNFLWLSLVANKKFSSLSEADFYYKNDYKNLIEQYGMETALTGDNYILYIDSLKKDIALVHFKGDEYVFYMDQIWYKISLISKNYDFIPNEVNDIINRIKDPYKNDRLLYLENESTSTQISYPDTNEPFFYPYSNNPKKIFVNINSDQITYEQHGFSPYNIFKGKIIAECYGDITQFADKSNISLSMSGDYAININGTIYSKVLDYDRVLRDGWDINPMVKYNKTGEIFTIGEEVKSSDLLLKIKDMLLGTQYPITLTIKDEIIFNRISTATSRDYYYSKEVEYEDAGGTHTATVYNIKDERLLIQ